MYKLVNPHWSAPEQRHVQRLTDNAFIPFVEDNTDYQEYLRWLEAGNTPEPAEENQ
jgi:hypothetical protein